MGPSGQLSIDGTKVKRERLNAPATAEAVFQVLPYKAWLTRYAAFHDLLASSGGMASCWYGGLPCSRRQSDVKTGYGKGAFAMPGLNSSAACKAT
jgi:hypothetical protein